MGTFILIAIPLTVLLIIYYAVTIWLDLGKMKNSNNGSDEETVVVPPVSDDHHSDAPEDDDSDEPMQMNRLTPRMTNARRRRILP